MKSVEFYQTKDGKRFDSIERAESHCLESAHTELMEIIKDFAPFVPNAYTVAQKILQGIITTKNGINRLASVVQWLKDSQMEEE